jgi:peptidoglycan/LPS O-acetylase OafA/YrhL
MESQIGNRNIMSFQTTMSALRSMGLPLSIEIMIISERISRYHWLDGMRGASALAVAIFHFRYFLPDGGFAAGAHLSSLAWYSLLWPLYHHGNVAVPFFWTLSGFVFGAAYLRKEVRFREFAAARFARLYPLHFATLIYVAALQSMSLHIRGDYILEPNNGIGQFFLQCLLANNWIKAPVLSFNVPIWSVSVEVLIYVAFFLYMKFGIVSNKSILIVISGFVALTVIADHPASTAGLLFFVGLMLFKISNNARTSVVATIGIASFILAIWISKVIPAASQQALMFIAVPASVLIGACMDKLGIKVPRPVLAIGESTYSIYLIQFPLIATAMLLWPNVATMSGSAILFVCYLLVLVSLSLLSYSHFELPARRRVLTRLLR